MSNLMDNWQVIAALVRNVRDVAIIDMDNDDYTLTLDEAKASVKAILNTGDGTKTLTIPSIADSVAPAVSIFLMTFGTNHITVAAESGAATAEVYSNDGFTAFDLVVMALPLGVYSLDSQVVESANKFFPAIIEKTDDYDVIGENSGRLLEMNNAAPKAFNFSATNVANMNPSATGKLRMKGAGVVTITASGGATVEGKTTLAINDIVSWYRDGSTNRIIIGYG